MAADVALMGASSSRLKMYSSCKAQVSSTTGVRDCPGVAGQLECAGQLDCWRHGPIMYWVYDGYVFLTGATQCSFTVFSSFYRSRSQPTGEPSVHNGLRKSCLFNNIRKWFSSLPHPDESDATGSDITRIIMFRCLTYIEHRKKRSYVTYCSDWL